MPRPSKLAEAAKIAAWAKNHPKEITNTPEFMNSAKRPWWLDYPVIRLGVPLGFVTFGAALMLANIFRLGVFLLYVGFPLIPFDIRYEPFFLKLKPLIQVAVLAIYVLAVAAISWKWIFVPAHFQVFAFADVPKYGPGSSIDGIKWRNEYSKLGLHIINQGDTDYDNFEVEISTDLVIADMRLVHGISDCKVAGRDWPTEVHWQRLEGDQPIGPVDNPQFDYKVMRITPDGKRHVSGTDATYRVSCNHLLANSQLDFVAALVVVNETSSNQLFGPAKPATWVDIKSHFRTNVRDRSETLSKCPMREMCKTK